MAVTAVAAIAAAGVGVWRALSAAKQKRDAKRQAERLRQPMYQVQPEYEQNRGIAAGLAGSGLTSSAKNYLTTENQRGIGSSLSAIENMAGSPNDVSKLFGAYSRSVDQTAAQDSQMQLQNIQNFMNANKEVAGQRTIGWSLNEDRTYQNKLKELKMQQQIADQNMWEGVNTTVGAIGSFGTSMSNSGYLKGMKGGSGGGSGFSGSRSNTPVQTVSAYGGVTPQIQGRSTPDVGYNTQAPTDFSSWDADRNEWSQMFLYQ